MNDLLKGRHLPDEPYTGLVESICALNLSVGVALAGSEQMSREDFIVLLRRLEEASFDALGFCGATETEIRETMRSITTRRPGETRP